MSKRRTITVRGLTLQFDSWGVKTQEDIEVVAKGVIERLNNALGKMVGEPQIIAYWNEETEAAFEDEGDGQAPGNSLPD